MATTADIVFQFTPLREGLLCDEKSSITTDDFNSRPCERGFKIYLKWCILMEYFNSRPCERGFLVRGHGPKSIQFQFTPLREGLHSRDLQISHPYQFQFTPLREGLRLSYCLKDSVIIFQFTPLREGLHRLPSFFCLHVLISIHAPARGASFHFPVLSTRSSISIHAPARGASEPWLAGSGAR